MATLFEAVPDNLRVIDVEWAGKCESIYKEKYVLQDLSKVDKPFSKKYGLLSGKMTLEMLNLIEDAQEEGEKLSGVIVKANGDSIDTWKESSSIPGKLLRCNFLTGKLIPMYKISPFMLNVCVDIKNMIKSSKLGGAPFRLCIVCLTSSQPFVFVFPCFKIQMNKGVLLDPIPKKEIMEDKERGKFLLNMKENNNKLLKVAREGVRIITRRHMLKNKSSYGDERVRDKEKNKKISALDVLRVVHNVPDIVGTKRSRGYVMCDGDGVVL